jgi:hypothetical protein
MQVILHAPPVQLPMAFARAGQTIVVQPTPSGLQVRSVAASAHSIMPGVHIREAHDPIEQICPLGQAMGVYPRPSSLHVCRVVSFMQLAAPGMHARVWQRPAAQDSPAAQEVEVQPAPRMLHVPRWVVSSHRVMPGTHAWARHSWVVLQNLPVAQSVSIRQSTQWPSAVSQTIPSAEHSRSERQVGGAGVQEFCRHTWPVGQSTSMLQSTQ